MIYINPFSRKIRGSHILYVICGNCKTDIAKYQKQGRGNLLIMHTDRILKSSIDFTNHKGDLLCPNCGQHLATKISLKDSAEEGYRMIRSAYNTKESNK